MNTQINQPVELSAAIPSYQWKAINLNSCVVCVEIPTQNEILQ